MSFPSLSSRNPTFTIDTNSMEIMQKDPIQQLVQDFGLNEAEDLNAKIFQKKNGLNNQADRNAVDNYFRSSARHLVMKLQGFSKTDPQLIRQIGISTLKELEVSSFNLIESFEKFQNGCQNFENNYAQTELRISQPTIAAHWESYTQQQTFSTYPSASPLIGAIEKYIIRPEVNQPSALETVLTKVQRIANGSKERSSNIEFNGITSINGNSNNSNFQSAENANKTLNTTKSSKPGFFLTPPEIKEKEGVTKEQKKESPGVDKNKNEWSFTVKPLVRLKNSEEDESEIQQKNAKNDALLEERKTELAKCIQMTDPLVGAGATACFSQHSKGLDEKRKKALASFIPNAYAGKAANEVFAPFAIIAKAVGATFKAAYLAVVNDTCQENYPGDKKCVVKIRNMYEGRDPEFNKRINKKTPDWVKSVGNKLLTWDQAIQQLDDFMADQYKSHPGIIHSGINGMLDVAFPGIAKLTWKSGKWVAKGVASTLKKPTQAVIKKTLSLLDNVGTITSPYTPVYNNLAALKTFTPIYNVEAVSKEIFRSACTLYAKSHIDFQLKVQKVLPYLTDYTSKKTHQSLQKFTIALQSGDYTILKLKDSRKILPAFAQGRSSNSVYFIEDTFSNFPYVVKDFTSITRQESQFAQELLAYEFLRRLNLKKLNTPRFVQIGVYQSERGGSKRGLLAMSNEGHSLPIYLDSIAKAPLGSPERLELLSQFANINKNVGEAIGEIHRKTLSSWKKPSPEYLNKEFNDLFEFYNKAKEYLKKCGFDFELNESFLGEVCQKFFKNPGPPAATHRDFHLPNLLWNPSRSKLSIIDPQSIVWSLNSQNKPIGAPVRDFIKWQVSLEGYGSKLGLEAREVHKLKSAFQAGYEIELLANTHTVEAHNFYFLYENLRRLGRIAKAENPSISEISQVINQIYEKFPLIKQKNLSEKVSIIKPRSNSLKPASVAKTKSCALKITHSKSISIPAEIVKPKRILIKKLQPEDLGLNPLLFLEKIEANRNAYYFRGEMYKSGDTLLVKIEDFRPPKGALNIFKAIEILRINALLNDATKIQLMYRDISSGRLRLHHVLGKRFGEAGVRGAFKLISNIPVGTKDISHIPLKPKNMPNTIVRAKEAKKFDNFKKKPEILSTAKIPNEPFIPHTSAQEVNFLKDIYQTLQAMPNAPMMLSVSNADKNILKEMPLFSRSSNPENVWLNIIKQENPTLESKPTWRRLQHNDLGENDFLIELAHGNQTYITKDKIGPKRILLERLGIDILDSLSLTNLKHSKLVSIGSYINQGTERYLITKTYMPGETLTEMMRNVGCFQSVKLRKEALNEFLDACQGAGKAVGEFHYKSLRTSTQPINLLGADRLERKLKATNDFLKKINIPPIEITPKSLELLSGNYQRWPGDFSYGFLDIKGSQFAWSKEKGLGVFDTEFIAASCDAFKNPLASPVEDYYKFLRVFDLEGLGYGLSEEEIALAKNCFKKGYFSEFKKEHSASAKRYFKVYHELDGLELASEILPDPKKFDAVKYRPFRRRLYDRAIEIQELANIGEDKAIVKVKEFPIRNIPSVNQKSRVRKPKPNNWENETCPYKKLSPQHVGLSSADLKKFSMVSWIDQGVFKIKIYHIVPAAEKELDIPLILNNIKQLANEQKVSEARLLVSYSGTPQQNQKLHKELVQNFGHSRVMKEDVVFKLPVDTTKPKETIKSGFMDYLVEGIRRMKI